MLWVSMGGQVACQLFQALLEDTLFRDDRFDRQVVGKVVMDVCGVAAGG